MSSETITPNAVSTIMLQSNDISNNKNNNNGNFQPVLQIINLKCVSGGASGGDRYRTVLSDGEHYIQGMLASQLNQLVHNGTMKTYCLLKIYDYMMNDVQGRKVVILLNANVIQHNTNDDGTSSISERIGNPIDISKANIIGTTTTPSGGGGAQPLYNTTNNNNNNKNPAAVSPVKSNNNNNNPYASGGGGIGRAAVGSNSSYGGVRNPYGGAAGMGGHNRGGGGGGAPIVRSNDVVGGTPITLISNLNMYTNRWTIRARVTSKSDIRTWSNSKGEGSLFSIELLDSSNTDIRATFFKEAVDKFYHFIEVNKVYKICGGRLKVANMQYNTCKSSYEMTLDQNSEIHLDDNNDTTDIAKQKAYHFIKINDIENIQANQTIDVLAIVKSVGDIATLQSKKTGQTLTKCDLLLLDDTDVEISLTLWGNQAISAQQDFNHQNNNSSNPNEPIIAAFRRARVSDFGGKSLSLSGTAQINPSNEDVPEAEQLRQWWMTIGSTTGGAATKSLSQRSGGGRGGVMTPLADRKDIATIKQQNLGYNNHNVDSNGNASAAADYISFKATITFIKKDREGGAWYTACPNADEPCKNRYKVGQTVDGQYQCDKCGGTYTHCVRRWIFSAVLEDDTSSTWVSFFNEQAETLLNGITADEAYQRTFGGGGGGGGDNGQDQDAYESIFIPALYTEWIFTCKVKNELVNDESRIKTSVLSMHPVDHTRDMKDIITLLEKM